MKARLQKSIVLFGGAFDPPHLGHRQVTEFLAGHPSFDEVWLVPVADHPFSKTLEGFFHRSTMVALNIQGLKNVFVCEIENTLSKPSYTIQTVLKLKEQYPHYRFTLAMGSDCKDQLKKWKNIEQLFQEVSFHFIPRAGFENSPFCDISSTQLRDMLFAREEDYTKYLVPSVASYIEENGLYQELPYAA
ncbi:MAG: hypothetical protein A3G32_06180 [Deltaproteobacteria bacterium RIFCSPLOWO2_12_FULL_40_28]|nr:MAG: hypothetical protein A3C45_02275 [Deltaproteobacteria bacterium RIFCSPHIGHO2_02_FULL_40_28]OGQ19042.1 MAG: hypothetical protein A3E27_05365 [Deltaproteobacteria bacterium RIFCSPHIGHO2_12_FULL_40_32]OGQ40214.1 MAG: hypothetical protein A3I69_00805 [Deltaproteobacteria bacterium RIFCSPLOWO2_02_FULL_40_36]OGQ53485.1 MAG: hypothetical protein A3G32_06180 [Deltaproteobacteria bacterium RIFCSPLOWO2_12_FULL_40_28]